VTYEEGIQKCLEHFGYVVIGYEILEEGDGHYEPGSRTLNIWNEIAPQEFTVIAPGMRDDWIKQARFLIDHHGARIGQVGPHPPERGFLYAKLVPTSSKLNIFSEQTPAGGKA